MACSEAETLHEKLHGLCVDARHLGSSVGVYAATVRLRTRLKQVLSALDEENPDIRTSYVLMEDDGHSPGMQFPLQRDISRMSDRNPRELAEELLLLCSDVTALLECFGKFPEFIESVRDHHFASDAQVCKLVVHCRASI